MICVACQADLGRPERVGRRDSCPQCGSELRTCRQCRHYDAHIRDGCREPQAERVLDPTRANFCDYFSAAETPALRPGSDGVPAARATGDATRTRATSDPTSARAPLDRSSALAALDRLFKR